MPLLIAKSIHFVCNIISFCIPELSVSFWYWQTKFGNDENLPADIHAETSLIMELHFGGWNWIVLFCSTMSWFWHPHYYHLKIDLRKRKNAQIVSRQGVWSLSAVEWIEKVPPYQVQFYAVGYPIKPPSTGFLAQALQHLTNSCS